MSKRIFLKKYLNKRIRQIQKTKYKGDEILKSDPYTPKRFKKLKESYLRLQKPNHYKMLNKKDLNLLENINLKKYLRKKRYSQRTKPIQSHLRRLEIDIRSGDNKAFRDMKKYSPGFAPREYIIGKIPRHRMKAYLTGTNVRVPKKELDKYYKIKRMRRKLKRKR